MLRKVMRSGLYASLTAGSATAVRRVRSSRSAPSGPQLERPKQPGGSGLSPWLVIGAALATGYVAAKVIDWRGHAHPRD